MPVLIQVCAVLSTLALLSLVGMTVRTMSRFLTTTNQVSNLGQSVRQSLARPLVRHSRGARTADPGRCRRSAWDPVRGRPPDEALDESSLTKPFPHIRRQSP